MLSNGALKLISTTIWEIKFPFILPEWPYFTGKSAQQLQAMWRHTLHVLFPLWMSWVAAGTMIFVYLYYVPISTWYAKVRVKCVYTVGDDDDHSSRCLDKKVYVGGLIKDWPTQSVSSKKKKQNNRAYPDQHFLWKWSAICCTGIVFTGEKIRCQKHSHR